MKKNRLVIERHAYAPELNAVYYAHIGAKLPGHWNKLSTAKNYAELREVMRRTGRTLEVHFY